jgi:hypothetical protein
MNANPSLKVANGDDVIIVFLTPGTIERTCQTCGVTVTVRKPDHPTGRGVPRKELWKVVAALRRQILWEALCDDCRRWWNTTLSEIQHPEPEKETSTV